MQCGLNSKPVRLGFPAGNLGPRFRVILAKGPSMTQPPPVPEGRATTSGAGTPGKVPFVGARGTYTPFPPNEYSEPSKSGC